MKVLSKSGIAVCVIAVFSALASTGALAAQQASAGFKIGLLLPDEDSTRYETQDRPDFVAAVKKLCSKCEILYANANASEATQLQQASSFLTQGVKVLVVDPPDGVAAASIVHTAAADGVPVVAYDRIIHSPKLSYVISNNYKKVGKLQMTALVKKLESDGVPKGSGIVMLDGSSTDNNALNMKKGALPVLHASPYKLLSHIDTWDGPTAQRFASSQITRFGNKIKAFYSANDTNAQAARSAMKAAGMPLVPTTGMDATLAGIQAIVAGNQYLTIYNPFKEEADAAARVAVKLGRGEKVTSNIKVDGIPATLTKPTVVTIKNIASTVVKDGVYTIPQICTAAYAKACKAAGLTK